MEKHNLIFFTTPEDADCRIAQYKKDVKRTKNVVCVIMLVAIISLLIFALIH